MTTNTTRHVARDLEALLLELDVRGIHELDQDELPERIDNAACWLRELANENP